MSNNTREPGSPAQRWFMSHYEEIHSRATASLCRLPAEQRADALAEVLAMIFCWAVNAARSGKLHRLTAYHMVVFACRHYRQGRRAAGFSSSDVSSQAAVVKHRLKLVSLESPVNEQHGRGLTLAQTLTDRSRQDVPPEQARRNIDYQEMLKEVSPKARRLFDLLSEVRGTGCGQKIARILNVSPGRVCQLKTQLAQVLARYDYAPLSA